MKLNVERVHECYVMCVLEIWVNKETSKADKN